nr:unnamed protein product [Spirometra erinaceieuropaei]
MMEMVASDDGSVITGGKGGQPNVGQVGGGEVHASSQFCFYRGNEIVESSRGKTRWGLHAPTIEEMDAGPGGDATSELAGGEDHVSDSGVPSEATLTFRDLEGPRPEQPDLEQKRKTNAAIYKANRIDAPIVKREARTHKCLTSSVPIIRRFQYARAANVHTVHRSALLDTFRPNAPST